MTDAQLRDLADSCFRATTISYPDWKKKAYKGELGWDGKAGPRSSTKWQQGFDALAQIAHTPPAPSTSLATYLLDLAPNWVNLADATDKAKNLNAVWVYTGPEIYAPPNGVDPYRCLLLDPRYSDSKGRAGVDEWWFVLRRGWPASFDPSSHGAFGAFDNGHNLAGDAGPGGGIGWSFGDAVSALSLDWLPGEPTPIMQLNNVKSGGLEIALPDPSRGIIHEYAVRFRAGRTDGSTVRPGEYEILADDVAVAKASNVNTVQRAQGPDGKWYVQRWMAVPWPGYYTKDLAARSSTMFQLPGVGRTLAEARADVPIDVGGTFSTQGYRGAGQDLGAPTLKVTPAPT